MAAMESGDSTRGVSERRPCVMPKTALPPLRPSGALTARLRSMLAAALSMLRKAAAPALSLLVGAALLAFDAFTEEAASELSAEGQFPKLIAGAVVSGTAQALREAREQLRRLSGLLISIQEDERRRIALDLHDGLGQSLSLIKLSIEQSAKLLDEGATVRASESLRQLTPRIDEALVELRRVSTELRPLMLDDLGLLPTLSWFFREFGAVCGGVVLEKRIEVAEHEVPVALHITLYRILQEAFHNVVKHAVADRVRVRLVRVDDALHLVIEDNGRGFDPATIKWVDGQTRGLGLLSMKERASLSGGTYHLDSAPGKGTRIEVWWPSATCPASIDCCRAIECIAPQVSFRGIRAAQDGDQKNTVNCV